MSSFSIELLSVIESNNTILKRETFKELEVKVELPYDKKILESLLASLTEIPERDGYEVIVDIEGNTEKIIKSEDSHKIFSFFEENQAELLTLYLRVNKSIDNNLSSIYLIDLFEEYIDEVGLRRFLIAFQEFFVEWHVFETLQEVPSFGSSTIKFQRPSNQLKEKSQLYKENRLLNIQSNACLIPDGISFSAEEFFLIKRSESSTFLNSVFDKLATYFTLASLSNTFEMHDNEEVSFKINGYKSICSENEGISCYVSILSYLYKIYSWVYENDKCSDKLGIARNVLSLYSKDNKLSGVNEQAWLSIQSNYRIYLKENVQKYLEVKNKITDYIFNHDSKIYSLTEQFLSSFRSNFLGIIGFFISVVIVNGLRQNGIDVIFSNEYLYVASSILLLSVVWLFFSITDVKSKKENSKATIDSTLRRNYGNILAEDEIGSYLKPAFKDSDKFFEKQLKKYICWWSVVLILFFAIFVIGNLTVSSRKSDDSLSVTSNVDTKGIVFNAFDKDIKKLSDFNNVELEQESMQSASLESDSVSAQEAAVSDALNKAIELALDEMIKTKINPAVSKNSEVVIISAEELKAECDSDARNSTH